MTIKNSFSKDFWSTFVDGINDFDCRLSGVILFRQKHRKKSDTNEIPASYQRYIMNQLFYRVC